MTIPDQSERERLAKLIVKTLQWLYPKDGEILADAILADGFRRQQQGAVTEKTVTEQQGEAVTEPDPDDTANLRSAVDSGDPHKLLAAVGHELRCVATYHQRGFGAGTVSVRAAFLRHLSHCIGAADVMLSAALALAKRGGGG